MHWDVITPAEPCTSPHGHEPVEVTAGLSSIPLRVYCPECGSNYPIVTTND